LVASYETRLPLLGGRVLLRGDAMSGWRDSDGRTAAERKNRQRSEDQAAFIDCVQRRPLSLVKPILGAIFITVLIAALLNFLI
jgi:hypothetical protein